MGSNLLIRSTRPSQPGLITLVRQMTSEVRAKSYSKHIDTAQAYRNETEAGQALRESGLARKDVYITTKYSGTDGADIETSIQDSLKNVRISI